MSTVEQLLERYKAEHGTHGRADADRYLEQLSGLDREELAIHIDRYLASAPPAAFDAAAFAQFREQRAGLVDRVLDGETLHELTSASPLGRTELATRLAERLGLVGLEAKVRGRLRDLENGDAQLERVRPTVWEALGEILGEPVERVRRAAENAVSGAAASTPMPAFGRSPATTGFASPSGALQDDPPQRAVDAAFFVD